jgi:hypothetical protein
MKLRPSLLFITSVAIVLYGLYILFFVDPGEEGWGSIVALGICGAGLLGLIIFGVLKAAFGGKVLAQLAIETLLIAGLIFYEYKNKGKYEFQLPHNYHGYVIVVYGVEKAPRLSKQILSNRIKIQVPPSGIILTSSGLSKNHYSDVPLFDDSILGEIQTLPAPFRRFSIPLTTDTLQCMSGKYGYKLWLIKDQPNWSKIDDAINRLDLKLQQACEICHSSISR